MTDPMVRLLASLPNAEPDRARTDRVRARCHAALAGRRRRTVTRLWEPLVVGLGGVYVAEMIRQALWLYGLL